MWMTKTVWAMMTAAALATAQQPQEPVNPSPIDGQSYVLVNQANGLQADGGSGAADGTAATVETRSFTSLSQRWALSRLPDGHWAISNEVNGLCLSANGASAVQDTCALSTAAQQWAMTATNNGYETLTNLGTGQVLDLAGGAGSAGTVLALSTPGATPTTSQQWLLRPAYFRGVDNALLEKQEADRVAAGLPWWQDAGHTVDVLQMLKNHGVNTIRIRPTSVPPYETLTVNRSSNGASNGAGAVSASCTGNGCYAETDDADIDLAKRAKQLGMAVELTLFFDGGSSESVPGAWASQSLTQLEASVYSYVKNEVEAFRAAGAMPDLVSIGNEVDTGLFGTLASPGTSFSSFAAVEQQGMQAVLDAASDTALGTAIPAPLRCIHITPAWDLTSFFTEARQDGIPFDAICQSYYPFFHGPLTSAQAATANPNNKPVEETVLTNAATTIGVPIFLMEAGEHYESGFDANDPWYPATVAGQRQFLIDLNSVMKGLPNHLGMGVEYWDAEGVNTTGSGGSSTNGDGLPDATYVWNGLTLFDNADTSGTTNTGAANYAAMLSGVDALGGKMDPTLHYKLVNVATGSVLGTAGIAGSNGIPVGLAATDGGTLSGQQWTITSAGNGDLILTDAGAASSSTNYALDAGTAPKAGSAVVLKPAATGASSQKWNLVTAGNGEYTLEQVGSGLVLASNAASGGIEMEAAASTSADWITPMGTNQLWQVVPTRITEQATTAPTSATTTTLSASTGETYPGQSVTLTATVQAASGSGSGIALTGSVTFLDGSATLGSSTVDASGVATLTTTLQPGANALSAVFGGNAEFTGSTSAVVTVMEADYTLAAGTNSVTLSAGGSGSVPLTVTPVGGFQGTVTMGCSSTLAALSCTFAPTTYTFNGTTTAQSGSVTIAAGATSASRVAAGVGWMAGLFCLPMVLVSRRRILRLRGATRRAGMISGMVLLLLCVAGVAAMGGCGGSGGNSGGGTGTTQTGTVTVTATSATGTITQSVAVTVTVQ